MPDTAVKFVRRIWHPRVVTLQPYREVLRLPGVPRLVLFAVLARIPHATAGLVLTLHVVSSLGLGYAAAGLVATASTVGMAIGSPWRGRAVDRIGVRRAVLPSVLTEVVVWGASPWLPYAWLVVAAFVGGVLALPTFTIMRQAMSVLVPEDRRRTAFAMDSIGVEISFVLGPTLGVLVATQVSTRAAVLLVGGALVVSGIALMVIDPPTRTPGSAPGRPAEVVTGRDRPGLVGWLVPAWFTPALVGVLGATLAATIVLAGSEVSMVAVLREHDAVDLTGVVMAVWSVASLVGGLVYGAAHRELSPNLLLLWLSLLCIPVGLAGGPWWLALLIIPTGALCAPVMSATGEAVARLVPEHVRGEAMGWHGSALTVGIALGSPLAGSMIDLAGPVAGFAVSGVVGVLLALVGLALHRRGAGGGLTDPLVRPASPGADLPGTDLPGTDLPGGGQPRRDPQDERDGTAAAAVCR